jgi:dTDP-4-dehydrorhamnose reductase
MVADMTFSPSYAPHVARAIVDPIDRKAFGTHHVTNTGGCTWFEFVRTAFAKAGLPDAPLEPISYAGIEALPSWQAALDEFLAARRARLANMVAHDGRA